MPKRKGHQRREWTIIGATRKLESCGLAIEVFEFCADITEYRHVLIVSDGWDVIAEADHFPVDWRELPPEALTRVFKVEGHELVINGCTNAAR